MNIKLIFFFPTADKLDPPKAIQILATPRYQGQKLLHEEGGNNRRKVLLTWEEK